MRFYLYIVAFVAGLAVHSIAAQSQNRGVVRVNHVGIAVEDLDAAVSYYTDTLGFPEAFRVVGDSGQPVLVYVQVSRETFVELQPANPQRRPGLTHFGVQVEDMDAVSSTLRARGASVSAPRSGSTKAILANVTDPNGITIELSELPPDSLQAEAIARWRD